jgi:biotin transport system ATP-binding protein
MDLGFSYPGQDAALEGVRFDLEPGALLCLAGRNGSGKSTLLSLLAGLLVPTRGSVEVAGFGRGREHRFCEAAGLLLQEPDLQILGATVGEDLLLGPEPRDEARARAMADRLDLAGLWEAPVQTLSHGQKRKLCLASTLLGQPEVLLLDEPWSGLDYPAGLEMRRILADNRGRGLTQVAAVHDLEPVADLADVLGVLDAGRLVLWGTPSEVMDRVREHGVRPPCSLELMPGPWTWPWVFAIIRM